jgi:hypothetical protein
VRQLPDAQKKVEEEDDDHCPKWETAPPTTKREWKAFIAFMKRKTSALTECDASAPFRVSEFPSCLLHAEADLKPKKAFKEASLRTNMVAWHSSDAVKWPSPPYVGTPTSCPTSTLLQVLKDTHEDLTDIVKGLKGIANVGSSIAAGSFNQGIEEVRHLIWESSAAKAIRPMLELCPPSLTHLFGNDSRIKEALEAERHRPY